MSEPLEVEVERTETENAGTITAIASLFRRALCQDYDLKDCSCNIKLDYCFYGTPTEKWPVCQKANARREFAESFVYRVLGLKNKSITQTPLL